MGHSVNPDREYRLLQQRYDRMVTGAPDSPVFMKILEMLFSPEDARLARRLPMRPMKTQAIAKKLSIPLAELDDRITDMAQRGLVIDLDLHGQRYALLPPVVIGFFEFTFMRAREGLDMPKLSELFHQYMFNDERFGQAVFQGETQIGRSLVREEALPDEAHTEILDYERATKLISSASQVGVSLCACRHKASHLDKACEAPQENCLTLNGGAMAMIRGGIAREISQSEGMAILDQAKEAGLAQTGDNVQNNVGYICNCCGCCCGMMNAVRHFDMRNAIVTSNWSMQVEAASCKGCGKCVTACPVNAISLEEGTGHAKNKRLALCDEDLCLGCGVCYSACSFDAIKMTSRPQRVVTPEGVFDRVVRMAIERGKLVDLIFDDPETLGYRAVGRFLSALEKSPPGKALMAIKPLQSVFLNLLVGQAMK